MTIMWAVLLVVIVMVARFIGPRVATSSPRTLLFGLVLGTCIGLTVRAFLKSW